MLHPAAILGALTIHKLIALQAISWAHVKCKVDIVAMAFKFDKNYPAISKAIDSCNRSVVFFAAAGNFGASCMEGFPACHKGVISVRATNAYGQFLDLNPPRNLGDKRVLGTLGDKVPLPRVLQVKSQGTVDESD
jgi:hypothetical protein